MPQSSVISDRSSSSNSSRLMSWGGLGRGARECQARGDTPTNLSKMPPAPPAALRGQACAAGIVPVTPGCQHGSTSWAAPQGRAGTTPSPRGTGMGPPAKPTWHAPARQRRAWDPEPQPGHQPHARRQARPEVTVRAMAAAIHGAAALSAALPPARLATNCPDSLPASYQGGESPAQLRACPRLGRGAKTTPTAGSASPKFPAQQNPLSQTQGTCQSRGGEGMAAATSSFGVTRATGLLSMPWGVLL